jgi:hypothetical protein
MRPDHPWTAAKFHGERDNLRAWATKATGPVVAVDEDVVVASVVLLLVSLPHPVLGRARRPSRATYLVSHRTTARIDSPPLVALRC